VQEWRTGVEQVTTAEQPELFEVGLCADEGRSRVQVLSEELAVATHECSCR
jgi:hypothetical protein